MIKHKVLNEMKVGKGKNKEETGKDCCTASLCTINFSSGQVACHFILFIAKLVNLSVEAFMKAMVLLSTLFHLTIYLIVL